MKGGISTDLLPLVSVSLKAEGFSGVNDVSPTRRNDEPIFVTEKVGFCGQLTLAVVAETRDAGCLPPRLRLMSSALL